MSNSNHDNAIDAQLRQVPVPAGLQERLHAIATWPDLELERTLVEVPVPSSLADRLRHIPDNDTLDSSLTAIETPVQLASSLYPITDAIQPVASTPTRSRWERILVPALAAALLACITLSYGSFAWQTLAHARIQTPPAPALAFLRPVPAATPDALPLEIATGNSTAPSPELGPESPYSKTEVDSQVSLVENLLPQLPAVEGTSSPADNKFQAALREFRHMLGSRNSSAQDVLDLDAIRIPASRGVLTPLIPGYDRGFLLRTNTHPPVAVSQNPALQQCLAPISLESDSFDRTQSTMRRGGRVKGDEVRVEDFLASLESGLGKVTEQAPVLTIAGGPSPFGPTGSRWLGLNLRTGKTAIRTREATHLIVAVELSPRMMRAGTWDWLRTGLVELLGRIETNDRLSIIVVQREVLFQSEPLEREARDWLQQVLPQNAPYNEPDTGLALQTALDTAIMSVPPTKSRHLVLVTDGSDAITSGFANQLRELGAGLIASQAGLQLGITVAEVSGESSVTPAAELIAKSLRGEARKASSRRRFVHLLQQELQGDAAITAAEAQVVVRFQPDAVASYRLVGHEANAMAQLVTPSTHIDLHPGDETHMLFEIMPQVPNSQPEKSNAEKTSAAKTPANPGNLVAECELSWVDPATGKHLTKTYKFTKNQWAANWETEPFWLKQAALASETAEWLRGSRAALREIGWNGELNPAPRLAAMARDLRVAGAETHSLPALLTLLNQLPAARK